MSAKHLFTKIFVASSLLLGGAALTSPAAAPTLAATSTKAATTSVKSALSDTSTYVDNQLTTLATNGSDLMQDVPEWMVLGYARSGAQNTTFATKYLATVGATLSAGKAFGYGNDTDYARVALAVTALGGNAEDVAGNNLFAHMSSLEDVTKQGLNGAIFALLAVDANPNYNFPTATDGTQNTKQSLVDYILGKELQSGGWNLYGSTADVDITAMSIQALAPYKSQASVKAAIDRGVKVMSTEQQADGGYTSYGTVNVESTDQVVVALTALGVNPVNAEFTKNGHTLLDNILAFHIAGSGFKHTPTGAVDGMATEQSFYALVAYERFLNGQTSLYDMSDLHQAATPAPAKDPEKTTATKTKTDTNSTKQETTAPVTKASTAKAKTTSSAKTGTNTAVATAAASAAAATKQKRGAVSNQSQPAATAKQTSGKTLPQLGTSSALLLSAIGLALLGLVFVIGRKVRFNA